MLQSLLKHMESDEMSFEHLTAQIRPLHSTVHKRPIPLSDFIRVCCIEKITNDFPLETTIHTPNAHGRITARRDEANGRSEWEAIRYTSA